MGKQETIWAIYTMNYSDLSGWKRDHWICATTTTPSLMLISSANGAADGLDWGLDCALGRNMSSCIMHPFAFWTYSFGKNVKSCLATRCNIPLLYPSHIRACSLLLARQHISMLFAWVRQVFCRLSAFCFTLRLHFFAFVNRNESRFFVNKKVESAPLHISTDD